MSKLPGVGELHEGVLERDPLDDSFQLRVLEGDKPRVYRLQDILSEYSGRSVRFTIAFTDRLEAAAVHHQAQDVQAVTLDDLSRDS